MTGLSVVLATRNNAKILAETLEALCAVKAPVANWKLIVVNNGSTDETAAVLGQFAARLPLVVLEEPVAGKNRALNRAIPHFDGDLIVFTDDDVIPDEDWLCQMWNAAERLPEFTMFGGRIQARWPQPADVEYFAQRRLLLALYTVTDPELAEGPIEPDLIGGPNMAVRAFVFAKGHRFDEAIGPDGNSNYAMGSETSFTRELAMAGYRGCFVPAARVQHIVRPHQLERSWMLKRASRLGRGEFRANCQRGAAHAAPHVLGYPRWLLPKLLKLGMRRLTSRCRRDQRQMLDADWDFHYWLGYGLEAQRNRR